MISLPSSFWSGWVIILTLGSLAVLVWLVVSIYFLKPKNDDQEPVHVWDENLREGSNAAPLWWFWLIFVALIFSAVYLLLYPGLGSFKGALQWSQTKQLSESAALHDLAHQQRKAELTELGPETLALDRAAMRTARTLFANHCGSCHGPQAYGQSQFPNLRDEVWQWGGDVSSITASIRDGRNAVMPPWGEILDRETIDEIARFVQRLNKDKPVDGSVGAERYSLHCAVCHGPQGAGNPALGAPSLVDAEWLYGGSLAAIRQSITLGRQGVMPAHGERLDEFQLAALAAWLHSGGSE